MPGDMRREIAQQFERNAETFNAPWFALLVGPYPSMVLTVVETCNVSAGVKRAACDLSRNCEIILAFAPLAGAISTLVAAPALPAIGIYTGLAALMSPLYRATCAGRAPTLDDVGKVAGALASSVRAVQSGDLGPMMGTLNSIGDAAIASGKEDPTARARAGVDLLRGKSPAALEAAAASRARLEAKATSLASAKLKARARAAAAADKYGGGGGGGGGGLGLLAGLGLVGAALAASR